MENNNNNNFAERLRKLRKKAGLTQSELAFLLGMHETTIRRWENDRGKPNLREIKKLAEVLHITEQELLNEAPESKWVLQIKINKDFQEEFIDMSKSVPCISDLNITPQGCFLSLGGSFELWSDEKKFKSFLKALTNTRKIIIQNGKDLGFIKEGE